VVAFLSSTLEDVHVENPITQQVGERVAKVRTQVGLTQSELAAEMTAYLGREIRPLTVTRLEGGKRPIGVDELVAAANALHVKPADLMADSDLPMESVAALAAGQYLVRATNDVNEAIIRWVRASDALRRTLRVGKRSLEGLPATSRKWLELLLDWPLSEVVSRAEAEGKGMLPDDATT